MLAIVSGAFVGLILWHSVPGNDAKVVLNDLADPVDIVFDANSVPHIEAKNFEDGMRTLGYLHARDRLWQMEVLRMAGQGRLSEMFGEATLDTDWFLRTLGMAEASRASFDGLQPQTKAALKAYSAGVNAYLDRDTRLLEPVLGPEFLILGHKPEQWEPWQSVLVIKVMSLNLGSNMTEEIKRFSLARTGFTIDEIDELVPYGPRDNPPLLPDLNKLYGFEKLTTSAKTQSSYKSEVLASKNRSGFHMDWPTGQSASNNWVISGSRTNTGKPILANDPHLGLTAPSVIFLVHVSWQENNTQRDIIGGTTPGAPFVIVGRNNRVSWGLTTTNLDSQDLYLERLNDSGDQYLTETGWEKLTSKTEIIKYGNNESQEFDILRTRNGPVLPDNYQSIGDVLPDGYKLSLRWPGLAHDDTTLDALYSNGRAQSVEEFIDGMYANVSPMQSIVVADVDGNIGLTTAARVPRRNSNDVVMGRAPVPGWLSQYQLDGYLSREELYVVKNPDNGAMATANANFFPTDYNEHITFDWSEFFRQARVEELILDHDGQHSVETSLNVMRDSYSAAMVKLRDLALPLIPSTGSEHQEIRTALTNWDGQMVIDRPEPLLMLAWFRHLNIMMLEDDLGDHFSKFENANVTMLIEMLQRQGKRNRCDDVRTSEETGCGELVSDALNAAINELTAEFGEDWQAWEYGNAHTAYSEHRPFAQVAPLAQYFDIEIPSSGGPYTLNRAQTRFNKEKPYRNRHAGAYRAVYDMSAPDKSVFIQSTGQSGNFLSPHYRDLSKIWADLEFIPMTTNPEDYQKDAIGRWEFTSQ